MKNSSKRIVALILAAVFMLCTGCAAAPTEPSSGSDTVPDLPVSPSAPVISVPAENPAVPLVSVSSYSEVFDRMMPRNNDRFDGASGTTGIFDDFNEIFVEDSASSDSAMPSEPSVGAGGTTGATGGSTPEHSDTNVQVEGVDESDIVKTDGRYIYILTDSTRLTIVKADGGDSSVVYEAEVCRNEYGEGYGFDEYVNDMYLLGNKLILLKSSHKWEDMKTGNSYYYKDSTSANAEIYDVSDPSFPRLAVSSGQDGWITSSRVSDGILYLITSYSVYDIDKDAPETYIPRFYTDGTARILPIGCIVVPEEVSSQTWTVISAFDIESGKTVSEISVLGSSSTVYMNRSSLYTAAVNYTVDESEPYTEDQYTVTECRDYSETNIMRFSIENGVISLAATGKVPGYLVNQFALDEYNGNLRVVTTTNENNYTLYKDEKHGWTNYESGEYVTHSGLYIYSPEMELLGSVTGLGEDERVYSVRFSGDIGYFVTFRETDPLFAVDLSDPTNPTVLSALKIPGFSEYLHLYDEGLLLGIGMTVDEENGWTENVKLSMFDVSDPENVFETAITVLDGYSSPALNNHRAVFIDTEKNLFGFAIDGSYGLFTWNGTEFETLAYIRLYESWNHTTRGLYIGDEFYICTNEAVYVLSMADWSLIERVEF